MLIWSLPCEGSEIHNLQRVSYLGTDHKKTYGVEGGRGGGFGRARSKTKYSPKGKLNEKIFMLWPRKIQTRNLITKKIPAARKFPPPITFLMVRPLGLKRGCQAFLAENVETGTKNRCVIEATHVLRRKLRKD